jgi:UTP--glucose-1-phosphate uridylyltransferase
MANANLMPRADSFNARVRGTSHIDFRTATTGVAAKTMRNEIGHLVATVGDPQTKKVLRLSFLVIVEHPMTSVGVRHRDAGLLLPLHPLPLRACKEPGPVRGNYRCLYFIFIHVAHSDWDRIKSPAEEQIVPYSKLPKPSDSKNLNKLAVLKVNGGLGTSMGTCIISIIIGYRVLI